MESNLSSTFGAPASPRRFPWWIPLTVGVLVVLAGLGLVVWPFVAATWILVILFGSALIANGLAMLVRARPSGASTTAGVLLVLAGVFAMVFSEFTVNALVTFVGVSLILVGVLWLIVGFKVAQGANLMLLAPALFALIGGIVTLVWPDFAIKVVAVLCGLFTIVLGVTIILTAQRLRRTPTTHTTIIID